MSSMSKSEVIRQLQELDDQRSALISKYGKMLIDSTGNAQAMQKRIPLFVVIRENLMASGGMMLMPSLVRRLEEQGHSLGRYPLRTVKNSITSPYMAGVFSVTSTRVEGRDVEAVSLLQGAGKIGRTMPERQQTKVGKSRVN